MHPVSTPIAAERPFWPAVRRGWRKRCPNCGEGRILRSYLKLHATCPHCGEDISHARVDDGPAYVAILVTGHVMLAAMLHVYIAYRPGPWVMVTVFSLGSVLLALYMLPRLKGAFEGVQWAKRMHGF